MQPLEERFVAKYVLHKHHLLKGSQAVSVLQAVNDIIALHATSAGTPYLSLFTRVRNFRRRHLDDEFYVKRKLLRLEAMRGTLFITSTTLAPILHQATKIPEFKISEGMNKWRISPSEYNELTQKLYSVLKGGGKTLPEIRKAVPKEMVRSVERRVGKTVYKMTNVNIVLSAMMRRGIVISEKGPEILRITKANRYVPFEEIYPKLNLESVGVEDARAMLIIHYIKAFGPVTIEDIAWWTGFSKTEVKKALVTAEKKLLRVEVSGLEEEFLMLETDYGEFVKFKPPKTDSVLLLPYEDPYTKGYKVRGRLVDMEREKKVYVGGGVEPTILLNGKIVGTWNRSIEEGKGPIRLHFFKRLKSDLENEVVHVAKAIGRVMADQEIGVEIEKVC